MGTQKYYNKTAYDPEEDYMQKMQDAAEKGDYEAAAQYEQQRNAKISGEGMNYDTTSLYSKYLPKTTAQQMDEILSEYKNRGQFEFDVNSDELFKQYKELATKNATAAAEEATAQSALLTGGYSNSYGATLATQAYLQEMDRLTELAASLYNQRKSEYDAEGDRLLNMYSLLAQKEDQDYNRDRYEQELAYNRELYEQEKAESEKSSAEEKAYNLAMTMLQNGMMPSAEVLSASGLSEEDAKKIYQYAVDAKTTTRSTGGSSSSGTGAVKLKAMTKSDMEELRDLYDAGVKSGDLKDFYNQKGLLEALGYDTSSFDTFANGQYESYSPKYESDSGTVTYGKVGVEDITGLIRNMSFMSNEEITDLMEEISHEFTKEQWAKIEPILKARGI